eukprot:TRINITY_DN232_c0_g8_i2.p1 TRINITY_DN232_c0_g8~~TRINITY_DN232_c0_g8_i2.p1  ORF type:complete len:331 (-),score=56.66 TRINITY_DN232_c0_g8_i2:54-1046(-)
MKLPPHPNIVQFLGLCLGPSTPTRSNNQQNNNEEKNLKNSISPQNDPIDSSNHSPYASTITRRHLPSQQPQQYRSTKMVTEYLSDGNLVLFMRNRVQLSELPTWADYQLMLQLGKGIAAGMDHLHKNKITHRDLAARNVLIQSISGSPVRVVPKISDFGLSAARKGDRKIPVRWSAPEVLLDARNAEPKSDVWSFGLVLFEISWNCRTIPYANLRSHQEVRLAVLRGKQQLVFPVHIPPHYVSLAKSCFALTPSLRPSFSQLYEGLAQQERLINQNNFEAFESSSREILRQEGGVLMEEGIDPDDLIYSQQETEGHYDPSRFESSTELGE